MLLRHPVRKLAAAATLLALPLLTLGACGGDDPIEYADVLVEVVHDFDPPPASGERPALLHEEPRTLTTDLGFEVVLTRAYLAISTVEVHESGGHVHEGPLRPTESPALPGVYAPMIEWLLEHDLEPVAMGSFRVPAGPYHGMTVTLEPAPEISANLPGSVNMVGRTLYLEGTVTKGEFSGGFTVSWGGSARIPVAFQDGSGHGHGAGARRGGVRAQADDFLLNLGPGAPTTLAVGKSCAGWFDGIDFTTASSGQVTAAVVAHLRNSFHHHVPEPAVGN